MPNTTCPKCLEMFGDCTCADLRETPPQLPAIAQLVKAIRRISLYSVCTCKTAHDAVPCPKCECNDALAAYEAERLPTALDRALEDAER